MSFVSSTRTCNEPIDWGMSNKQRIHGDGYGRYEYPAEEEPDKAAREQLVRDGLAVAEGALESVPDSGLALKWFAILLGRKS